MNVMKKQSAFLFAQTASPFQLAVTAYYRRKFVVHPIG